MVVGRGGLLEGNIYTQDAVIAGRVLGAIYAESHLALEATSEISGEIQAGQMQVEDGAALKGQLAVGKGGVKTAPRPSEGNNQER